MSTMKKIILVDSKKEDTVDTPPPPKDDGITQQKELILIDSKRQTVERIPSPPKGAKPKRKMPANTLDVMKTPVGLGETEKTEKAEKLPPTCEAVKEERKEEEHEMMDTSE